MFKENFNQAELPQEKLAGLMSQLADKINTDLGDNFLNSDASVDSRQWQDVYGEEEINDDEKMIRDQQLMWSAATNDNTRDFYKKKYGWAEDGQLTQKILDQRLADREASKPAMLEKAVVAIFHKILGDKFIVVRSSTHDDFQNGVDNLIINKETGDVVCAFDEVRGETKHGRINDKKEKIIRKAKEGGTEIKYGFTFTDQGKTLVKRKIENVPTFYLSMEPDELDNLLRTMSGDLQSQPTAVELKVFDGFIKLLEEECATLHYERIPLSVQKNIVSFEKSLLQIKKMRQNF
jgi:hypothetical protein